MRHCMDSAAFFVDPSQDATVGSRPPEGAPQMHRVLATLLVLVPTLGWAGQTLDRNLDHYFAFAQRRATLKNFNLEASGCHFGVNCAQPNRASRCGVLRGKRANFGQYSQAVGDSMCSTGDF